MRCAQASGGTMWSRESSGMQKDIETWLAENSNAAQSIAAMAARSTSRRNTNTRSSASFRSVSSKWFEIRTTRRTKTSLRRRKSRVFRSNWSRNNVMEKQEKLFKLLREEQVEHCYEP